jgi:hypothetical protein
MTADEERQRWEVGVGYGGFKLWAAREVDRIGKLSKSARGEGGFSFLRKKQIEEPNYRALSDEFRAFLSGVKDNVDLYLWFALSALIERDADRKFEAKIYHLFGSISSTFQSIGLNFDPGKVTPDLLEFLKALVSTIAGETFSFLVIMPRR